MATGLGVSMAGAIPQQQPQRDPIFGTDPRSKTYAQDTFAALTRAQWDDYLRNFVPLENLMINYATDPNVIPEAVRNAREDVADSFSTQQGINERRLRGLGVQLNPDEQKAVERRTGLAQSLADVSAANLTTQRVRDRQQSLLGNPAPSMTGG